MPLFLLGDLIPKNLSYISYLHTKKEVKALEAYFNGSIGVLQYGGKTGSVLGYDDDTDAATTSSSNTSPPRKKTWGFELRSVFYQYCVEDVDGGFYPTDTADFISRFRAPTCLSKFRPLPGYSGQPATILRLVRRLEAQSIDPPKFRVIFDRLDRSVADALRRYFPSIKVGTDVYLDKSQPPKVVPAVERYVLRKLFLVGASFTIAQPPPQVRFNLMSGVIRLANAIVLELYKSGQILEYVQYTIAIPGFRQVYMPEPPTLTKIEVRIDSFLDDWSLQMIPILAASSHEDTVGLSGVMIGDDLRLLDARRDPARQCSIQATLALAEVCLVASLANSQSYLKMEEGRQWGVIFNGANVLVTHVAEPGSLRVSLPFTDNSESHSGMSILQVLLGVALQIHDDEHGAPPYFSFDDSVSDLWDATPQSQSPDSTLLSVSPK